ncbi:MAG: hypothetical protein H0W84_10050, partial [Bacteroidetes bacterium]|nr:hypothetical protein [Bacteroidota bacterium]
MMVQKSIQNNFWYVYVILCEERKLFSGITINIEQHIKKIFSPGSSKSKFFLKYKPLFLLKKYRHTYKEKAKKRCNDINSFNAKEKEDFILSTLLKKPKPIMLNEISNNKFEFCCPKCHKVTELTCEQDQLEIEFSKFKCICQILKEKIDSLFEQAILGAGCLHNGRFML